MKKITTLDEYLLSGNRMVYEPKLGKINKNDKIMFQVPVEEETGKKLVVDVFLEHKGDKVLIQRCHFAEPMVNSLGVNISLFGPLTYKLDKDDHVFCFIGLIEEHHE